MPAALPSRIGPRLSARQVVPVYRRRVVGEGQPSRFRGSRDEVRLGVGSLEPEGGKVAERAPVRRWRLGWLLVAFGGFWWLCAFPLPSQATAAESGTWRLISGSASSPIRWRDHAPPRRTYHPARWPPIEFDRHNIFYEVGGPPPPPSLCIVNRASCIVHRASCIVHRASKLAPHPSSAGLSLLCTVTTATSFPFPRRAACLVHVVPALDSSAAGDGATEHVDGISLRIFCARLNGQQTPLSVVECAKRKPRLQIRRIMGAKRETAEIYLVCHHVGETKARLA